MTGDKAFVDTNILLRAIVPSMPYHDKAEALVEKMWEDDAVLWISRQVVREFLVQVTRPNGILPALTSEEIKRRMLTINALFRVADENEAVATQLLALVDAYSVRGKQVHDANIVATMLVYGVKTLLTINVTDFKRFGDKITIVSI